jgi:hypothetical protein
MHSTITITHQPLNNPREFCLLPVRYQVEDDALINAPIIYCAIDIPREHIPGWLNPVPMETTYFCQNGMHMVLYNIGDVINADAREFCSKLYLAIMQAEHEKGIEHHSPAFAMSFA